MNTDCPAHPGTDHDSYDNRTRGQKETAAETCAPAYYVRDEEGHDLSGPYPTRKEAEDNAYAGETVAAVTPSGRPNGPTRDELAAHWAKLDRRTCGIHGDPTGSGRCAGCDTARANPARPKVGEPVRVIRTGAVLIPSYVAESEVPDSRGRCVTASLADEFRPRGWYIEYRYAGDTTAHNRGFFLFAELTRP